MKTSKKWEELAAFVLKEAKRLGASDCEVTIIDYESVDTSVRLGQVEELQGVAQGLSLQMRVFLGKKSASTSTSDVRRRPLTKLIRETIALAQYCPEDEFAGLPEKELLATEIPNLDLYDPSIGAISPSQKIDITKAAEAAAMSSDKRISSSEGATFSDMRRTFVYASSQGFIGGLLTSTCSLSTAVIASEGSEMKVGSWGVQNCKFANLPSAETIGKKAAERALQQLGAKRVKSQVVPVVFDQIMASRLLSQFASALAGNLIYQNSSFLAGKLGTQIAASNLHVIDDPLIPGALGSSPFRRQGLAAQKRTIVHAGKLEGYFLDPYSARKLGSKANSGDVSNLYIKPGEQSPEEIIASVPCGLYLTNVSGPGFNVVSGGYSLGASGIWIENGKLTYPVNAITIASTLPEMFAGLQSIGNDLEFRSSINSPTLKFSSMTIGGE